MSLVVSGLVGIASDPVETGTPNGNQNGKFFSVRVVSVDPRRPKKNHYFTLEVFVPKEEEKLFLQNAKRGEVFQFRTGTLVDRNGTPTLTTSTRNFCHLEVAWWHPNPQ